MHQEGGTAGDIGLKQAHACISGIPAADHNEVEFVAQKFVNDTLVTAIDLEEVSKRAQGRRSVLVFRLRAEDIANGIRGVAVLANQSFKRTAASIERGRLGAQFVSATARLRLLKSPGFERVPKLEDLGLQPLETIGHTLEGKLRSAALQV